MTCPARADALSQRCCFRRFAEFANLVLMLAPVRCISDSSSPHTLLNATRTVVAASSIARSSTSRSLRPSSNGSRSSGWDGGCSLNYQRPDVKTRSSQNLKLISNGCRQARPGKKKPRSGRGLLGIGISGNRKIGLRLHWRLGRRLRLLLCSQEPSDDRSDKHSSNGNSNLLMTMISCPPNQPKRSKNQRIGHPLRAGIPLNHFRQAK